MEQMSGYLLATPRELRLVQLVKDGWVTTKQMLMNNNDTPRQVLQRVGAGNALIDLVTDDEIKELKERHPDFPADDAVVWSYKGPRLNALIAEDVLTSLLRVRSIVWLDEETRQYTYKAIGVAFRWRK
ncbi:MAG: hypothetical protein HYT16_03445 [DPANN group archaeon]|nr:hypothetical protein [DPANN group archaeon]